MLALTPKKSVVLVKCDNPVFNGALAFVERVEDWGAHLLLPYWRPGNSDLGVTTYRAGWEEMVSVGTLPDAYANVKQAAPLIDPTIEAAINAPKMGATEVEVVKVEKSVNGMKILESRAKGYTGDVCHKCQGARMVRTGPCLRCEDCGETSGGCG